MDMDEFDAPEEKERERYITPVCASMNYLPLNVFSCRFLV
jgi:hypothetical protein